MRISLSRAALSMVAAVVLSACSNQAEGGEGAAQGGGMQMPPPEVSVVTIATHRVTLETELPGRTSPFLIAEVRPQVGGLILKRLFEEGSDVRQGDVLYEIDPASYEVALAAARAQLMRAEAALTVSATRSRRYDTLAEHDVVSKQDRDDVSGAVRTLKADVAAARAALDAAKLDLERTQVASPISGRVGRSSMMQGALVVPYQTALAVVQQLDPIYVDITRAAIEITRLRRALAAGTMARPGGEFGKARVRLLHEDGSTYAHAGALQFADASVDPATGNVTLRAVFPNPAGELLPGMYVRAILEEGVIEDALLVPQQGVTRDPRGDAIALVVTKEGKVESRTLDVDRSHGDQWLVSGGIAAGEQVIVEGLQKVMPGGAASAVPYTPTKAQAPAAPGDDQGPGKH
jgi:membrane fusion protein, multidrug efflux system